MLGFTVHGRPQECKEKCKTKAGDNIGDGRRQAPSLTSCRNNRDVPEVGEVLQVSRLLTLTGEGAGQRRAPPQE